MGTEAELQDGHNSYTMANSATCTSGRVANVDYCLMPSKSLILTSLGKLWQFRLSGQGRRCRDRGKPKVQACQ